MNSRSFKKIWLLISACIAALGLILHILNTMALAGDATSFNPTSVAVAAEGTESGVPIGTIVPWASTIIPSGWLECNGQSTVGYPELAAIVGSMVPNFKNQFLRGQGAGRVLLSRQGDAIRNISGNFMFRDDNNAAVVIGGSASGAFQAYSAGSRILSAGGAGNGPGTGIAFSAAYQVPTATENRPVNVAVKYIIKAK